MSTYAAVDLGASSGRVMRAAVSPEGIELREAHRFPNRPVRVRGTLHWDVLALWSGVLDGLCACGPVDGIGVDSWAVDYGLLDADGALLGNPVHYRDGRTSGVAASVGPLFPLTGVQDLPFNTAYQLVAAHSSLPAAAHALLIPDLFTYWLTGTLGTELTNASTTGLLDARTRTWSAEVLSRLGLRDDLFPPLCSPGTLAGPVLPSVADESGVGPASVVAVGSHDTASAVLGVPSRDPSFAYISCGTWSLVGVELPAPVITEAAQQAGFSNELGVDGTVRFLRNVMGLWLLQESVRTWEKTGPSIELDALLAEAGSLPPGRSLVDPDRPEFLPPGDMPARIAGECARTDQPVPATPAEFTRCILDSLAAAYRRSVRAAASLSGSSVEAVHLVGGGAQNALLCQLTADACELPVIAGPVEAAAYGNVLVQARAAGVLHGGPAELRAQLRRAVRTTTYHPRSC